MKKQYHIFGLMMMGALALFSCSDEDEGFVLRSDNVINLESSGEAKAFTICTDGNWNISTDSEWLTIDQTSGLGDGATRQKIMVGAKRNISAARVDSFYVNAAGKHLKVMVNQGEGKPFTMGTPSISQALQAGLAATGASINIPYTYGYKGMVLTITATLSGAGAEGLSVDPYTVTLESAKGTIEIPIKGTPVNKGDINIQITTDDATVTPTTITSSVSGRILIEQHFDLFVWGSDIVANKPGIKGGYIDTPEGRVIDPSVPVKATNTTDDGGADIFNGFAQSFLESRGMIGWSGLEVHEHPGYIKMGTGKVTGYVTTPALGYTPASGTVTITCRAAQYWGTNNSSLSIKVSEGTPSISSYKFQYEGTKQGQTWEPVSFTITGVTADTKITFSVSNATRFCLDDIVVSE